LIGKILDLVSRTASSEERANCIVLWPVWPPRTIKCNTVILLPAGLSMPVKVGVGFGGGVAAALLVAGCAFVSILSHRARNARNTNADKAQLHPFCTAQRNAPGFFNRGASPKADWAPTQMGTGHRPDNISAGHDPPPISLAPETAGPGTAFELSREDQTPSDAARDAGVLPREPVVVVVDTSTSAGEHTSGDTGAATYGGSSQSSGQSHGQSSGQSSGPTGRTDSARTMYSVWTRSRFNRKADRRTASEIPESEVGSSGADQNREELWTRGVDPADVEILRDTLGQPVVLGRGAYAVVYLGRWQATLVAVKVMLASDSDSALREVKAEADILRGLRHPNVVLLMAICISPGQLQQV
jgi:hypothetical protein